MWRARKLPSTNRSRIRSIVKNDVNLPLSQPRQDSRHVARLAARRPFRHRGNLRRARVGPRPSADRGLAVRAVGLLPRGARRRGHLDASGDRRLDARARRRPARRSVQPFDAGRAVDGARVAVRDLLGRRLPRRRMERRRASDRRRRGGRGADHGAQGRARPVRRRARGRGRAGRRALAAESARAPACAGAAHRRGMDRRTRGSARPERRAAAPARAADDPVVEHAWRLRLRPRADRAVRIRGRHCGPARGARLRSCEPGRCSVSRRSAPRSSTLMASRR